MYCEERGRERGWVSLHLSHFLSLSLSLSLTHTRTQTQKAAAGRMPGSTLAIKNRKGQINMARLCVFKKIYSEDKVEV